MKKIILGLITFLLVSCTGVANNFSPAVSPTATIPPTSTKIPAAATSPTVTAEPTLSSYSLPSWMSSPSTNILAAFITDNSNDSPRISFYNAATGEKYDIDIPNDSQGYFWYDNAHFGFLSNDLKSLELIDLNTGQTSEMALEPESLRLWNLEHENSGINNQGPVALEIVHDNADNGILLEQVGSDWDNKSKSKLFAASWGIESRDTITIVDTRNQQTTWEIKLPADFFGTEFAWSPTDENRLAVIQGKPVPNSDIDMTSIKLSIVDVVNKKTLWTYDGDFGRIHWSPDGKMILYQNNASRFSSYGVGFQEAPCILFVETGIRRCLRSIPKYVPSGLTLATTADYVWGADNESVFYTYVYGPQQGSDKWSGNLCIYSLINSHIVCPTQNLAELRENSVVYYEISPDQQFIHFCLSASSILNDYADTSSDGIIGIDGKNFFSWVGNSASFPQSCSEQTLWRPLP